MPAAHDIYSDQLRELQRGQALYYPEPSPDEGPVEIGDVGYIRQGAFCRLFNASRPADHPVQVFGVPDRFEPLSIGRTRKFEAALEPGPLHSKTIFRMNTGLGSPGAVLPASASFQFSCTSSRGAILMLETQMSKEYAVLEQRMKAYLVRNCLIWYDFARDIGVQVEFGDIMLVTEVSKTAAWASAVYSQSSREFGMSFSAGGAFLPISSGPPSGLAVAVAQERIGPVEYRRSQAQANSFNNTGQPIQKDHTVFIKAYHLGSRSLYLRFMARKVLKTSTRNSINNRKDLDDSPGDPSQRPSESSNSNNNSGSSLGDRSSHISSGSLDSVEPLTQEWPDFQPAVALLAHKFENSNLEEIAIVHDNEWCSTHKQEPGKIIDDYATWFFAEMDQDLPYPTMGEIDIDDVHRADHSLASQQVQPSRDGRPAVPPIVHSQHQSNSDMVFPSQLVIKPSVNTKSSGDPIVDNQPVSNATLTPETGQLEAHRQNGSIPNPILASPEEVKATSTNHWPDYWRITLLGDGGTGKTALAVRFTLDVFPEAYDPTIEDSWRKQAKVDNRMSLVEIIDTAGQEEYASFVEQWTSQGQAFALVFSLLSRTTFERIKSFHQVMVRNKGQAVPFVLVGNKSDRIEEREITEEEGAELAMSFGCPYIESSARTGNRVDDVFYGLVRKLRFGGESKGQKHVETTRGSRQHKSRSCIVM